MIDAMGNPSSLLLLGGSSDIAVAIARAYASRVHDLRVVLAARPGARRDDAVAELTSAGCCVEVLDFDALRVADHAEVVRLAGRVEDVDVAVVAFGLLGDNEEAWRNVDQAIRLAETNYVAAVASGVALADLVQRQGHGVVVALSSVAGERPRRSNFVYGSTKAGFDAFFVGLGQALRPHGGWVLVVRPGFVRSAMTEELDPAPLAVSPAEVAAAVVDGVTSGADQIWVPRRLRVVMSGLRHLPRRVFYRLPI